MAEENNIIAMAHIMKVIELMTKSIIKEELFMLMEIYMRVK